MARESTTSSAPLSWRARLGLAAFGAMLGVTLLIVAAQYLLAPPEGSEFESIAELRSAMLTGDGAEVKASLGQKDEESSVSFREIINPHPDDKIIYDLRPNLSVRFQRAEVVTNRCGMRDVERSIAKPPGVIRIAILGDSFTFGWGVEREEAFPAVLERFLNDHAKGAVRFEVLNFGVPGYSTFQEVAAFKESGADFEPDAVVVFFVENDFGLPFFVSDIGGQGGGLMSSVRFVQLAEKALHPELEDERLRLQGLDPNTALADLSSFTRERGMRLFLAPNPKRRWERDRKRLGVLRSDPGIEEIGWVDDFYHLLETRGINREDLSLSFDPHPSPLKHALMGELLAAYLSELTPL